jgi:hypothetical protein
VNDAESEYDSFVRRMLSDALKESSSTTGDKCEHRIKAIEMLGAAFHAISDSYSPKHKGFQEWGGWPYIITNIKGVKEHAAGETLDVYNSSLVRSAMIQELRDRVGVVLIKVLKGCKR